MSSKALCFEAALERSLIIPILLPRCHMNALNSCDKTGRKYSPAPADDLIIFWRSKIKVAAAFEVMKASTSMLGHQRLSSRFSNTSLVLCMPGFFLGRLLRVDLIKWVSNVRPYVRPSTKSFFDCNEIWYVGRG